MVSFEAFRAVDGTPVYLQIINFIKRGAIAGTIRDGDELPSRRVLSALLGINPNTVQKAFSAPPEAAEIRPSEASLVSAISSGHLTGMNRVAHSATFPVLWLMESCTAVLPPLSQTKVH